jgi:hypothetical protein
MLQDVMIRKKPAEVVLEAVVQRGGLLDVLRRAATDPHFIAQLTDDGEAALADYDLTWREEAALLSGDIQWIEAHFGKLDATQRTWLECRLQQEKW